MVFRGPTRLRVVLYFLFFNDTAPTEIYTLSLHDALPIWLCWFNHDSIRASWSSSRASCLLKRLPATLKRGSHAGQINWFDSTRACRGFASTYSSCSCVQAPCSSSTTPRTSTLLNPSAWINRNTRLWLPVGNDTSSRAVRADTRPKRKS